MRLVDLLHRWAGGLLGLILAILGLTGAILVHKEEWIGLPHAADARIGDPVVIGQATARLLEGAKGGESLIYASDRLGLIQYRQGTRGQYVTQTGDIVAQWESQWQRPELWLFDLHHHLFAGDSGEIVAGMAGLGAVGFVLTGTILWWRTRRMFELRLWPKRLSGPAIRMHHRDLGIIAAPILLVVALTGTMMIFRSVAGVVLAPLTPFAQIERDLKPPVVESGPLSARLDWTSIVSTAQRNFPDAQIRILALPKKPGEPITIRMKRAAEWLPNGRSTLWFDAATGALLAKRDAMMMASGTQTFNMAYPIHAGKVGGLAYRLALTAVGLALFLLGLLTTWSFWFRRRMRSDKRSNAALSDDPARAGSPTSS